MSYDKLADVLDCLQFCILYHITFKSLIGDFIKSDFIFVATVITEK